MNPELTFHYVHAEQIGYGRMGIKIAEQMRRMGVTVYDDDGSGDQQAPLSSEYFPAAAPARDLAADPTNAVCWASIPAHMLRWREGQHTSMLTMWESMTLPEGFRDRFHEIDRLIVPSVQNLELFGQFHDDVRYVPLGIDPEVWNYSPPSAPVPEFRFLISGRGARKGVDLAAKAFRTVFRGVRGNAQRGVPKLIIKSARGHVDFWGDGIEHITSYLSPEDELGLYRSAHCYLQPSRGEGFGLQPLQAIATGRPTILTNAHGHASFAHLGIGISAEKAATPAGSFMYGEAGDWWEPNFEELCEAMWAVYTEYDRFSDLARYQSLAATSEFTWERTAEAFIDNMADVMGVPYAGDGSWVSGTAMLFRVVIDPARVPADGYRAEIAGRSLIFRPGVEYWETADIKRVLFDRGILDVACLDGQDHGLQPDQAEQLGVYRAEKEWCPACHQQLNTGVQKADVIYEQMCAEAGVAP